MCDSRKLPNTWHCWINWQVHSHSVSHTSRDSGEGTEHWDESAKITIIDFSSYTGTKYLFLNFLLPRLIKLKVTATIRGKCHLQNKNKIKTQHVLQAVMRLITTLNQVKILSGYLHLYLLPVEHKKELSKKPKLFFFKAHSYDWNLVRVIYGTVLGVYTGRH